MTAPTPPDPALIAESVAAVDPHPEPKCDHICLKDEGHVERGEPHFYGYENPSPQRPVGPVDAPVTDGEAPGPAGIQHADYVCIAEDNAAARGICAAAEARDRAAKKRDGFKPCGCRVGTTDRDCPDCNDGEVIR